MKRTLILLAVLLLAPLVALQAADKPGQKPNVLVIVADDLGYADVGFQGCKDIPTPNLDRLARQSVHCTSGYVSHPFCSPTRAGLITGRYQQHFGHEYNPAWLPDDTKSGLPLDQVTLPQLMKKAGYVTGAVGKWHLGAHPQFHPNRRGFDDYFGFRGGGHIYLPGTAGGEEYNVPLEFNGEERPFDGYLTDILGREAARFVERHRGKSWLLYLAFNAPHTPLSAPPELLEKFAGIADEGRRAYAAMVHAMDAAVGVVLARLDTTQQRENTLVFFISDNGGPDLSVKTGKPRFTDNTPLRGCKGQVYDGGIRVPFLVSWPAKLKPGTYEQSVISLDFLPTALAAGGGGLPDDRKIDGVDLIPFLSGKKTGVPHEALFWRSAGPGGNYAARMGDWKYVRLGDAAPELYNLRVDAAESKNLAAESPEVLVKLSDAVGTWDKLNIEPLFSGPKNKQNPAKSKKKAQTGAGPARKPQDDAS
jgi:arylsulfatase A-like enzyme